LDLILTLVIHRLKKKIKHVVRIIKKIWYSPDLDLFSEVWHVGIHLFHVLPLSFPFL